MIDFLRQVHFAFPFAFLLLPILFACWFIPGIQVRKGITRLNASLLPPILAELSKAKSTKRKTYLRALLPILFSIALVTAVARPQYIGEPISLPKDGRNLMLALDISGSMNAADMSINRRMMRRFDAVQSVVREFIAKRQGDKLGLILFGEQAYLQAPFTFDVQTVQQFMDDSFLGLIPATGTAIGDAIGLTLKKIDEDDTLDEESEKVLILLTDGDSNMGIDPLKAADLAAQSGVKIYTIGIGSTPENAPRDFLGRPLQNDLNEPLLKEVAEKTQGHYYRASNVDELAQIYNHLDQIEKIEDNTQFYRPIHELYYLPLLVSLFFMLINIFLIRREDDYA